MPLGIARGGFGKSVSCSLCFFMQGCCGRRDCGWRNGVVVGDGECRGEHLVDHTVVRPGGGVEKHVFSQRLRAIEHPFRICRRLGRELVVAVIQRGAVFPVQFEVIPQADHVDVQLHFEIIMDAVSGETAHFVGGGGAPTSEEWESLRWGWPFLLRHAQSVLAVVMQVFVFRVQRHGFNVMRACLDSDGESSETVLRVFA